MLLLKWIHEVINAYKCLSDLLFLGIEDTHTEILLVIVNSKQNNSVHQLDTL